MVVVVAKVEIPVDHLILVSEDQVVEAREELPMNTVPAFLEPITQVVAVEVLVPM